MWPQAIAQLIELLPHMSRLLPLADRFFSNKTAEAEASRSALQQVAEDLREDLGSQLRQVTASHAGMYRQLNEQSEKLGNIAADARSARLATELAQARVTALEARFQRLLYLMIGVSLMMGIVLILVAYIALHLGRMHP